LFYLVRKEKKIIFKGLRKPTTNLSIVHGTRDMNLNLLIRKQEYQLLCLHACQNFCQIGCKEMQTLGPWAPGICRTWISKSLQSLLCYGGRPNLHTKHAFVFVCERVVEVRQPIGVPYRSFPYRHNGVASGIHPSVYILRAHNIHRSPF
jgi:hypothetical protein